MEEILLVMNEMVGDGMNIVGCHIDGRCNGNYKVKH